MGIGARHITAVGLMVLVTACEASAQEKPLMETMPAGHTVYLTINPDAVDMEPAMISLGDCLERAGEELPSFAGGLGFSPFDWSAWSDRLALAPDREMGMIIDTEDGDVTLVAFFIPTTDPAAVESFYTGITTGSNDFDGVISMGETGSYVMVAAALDQRTVDASDLDLDSGLGLDTVFSSLSGEVDSSPYAFSFYLDGGVFSHIQGIAGALLTCRAEGRELHIQLLADTDETVTGEFGSLIASAPTVTDSRFPEGISTVLRASLNMEAFSAFLARQGLDREFGQGISVFGVGSLQELLDIFSGDLFLGMQVDENSYSGILAMGLRDPDRAHRLLGDVHAAVSATGESIDTFEWDRDLYYRVTDSGIEGMETLELGVVGRALTVTGGIPIREAAEGIPFSEIVGERGLGLADSGGLLLISDLAGIRQIIGSRASLHGTDILGKLAGISGSLSVDEGLYHARLNLEMSGAEPFSDLVDVMRTLLSSM